MSRLIRWQISVDDLEELFRRTFGEQYQVAVEWVDFDDLMEVISVSFIEDSDEDDTGFYAGIDLN